MIENPAQDFRYGLRMLARSPGFSMVIIITLALAIGANTAIFSAVNAVLLHALPWKDADRLLQIWETHPTTRHLQASYPDYRDWRAQAPSLEQTAAYTAEGLNRANLNANGIPVEVQISMISGNLLPMLGIQPVLGRNFAPDEMRPGHDDVMLIGYALWKERFGGNPQIVGQATALDGVSMRIVGVLPPATQMPAWADALLPITRIGDFDLTNRKHHPIEVIAKLRAGASIANAQTEVSAISRRLAAAYPVSNNGIGAEVVPLLDEMTGNVRLPLIIALMAVGLVLLVACSNVANLLLARAAVRSREVAVRIALGAGRTRLIRQFLTESLILSALGAALGLLALAVFAPMLRNWAAGYLPRAEGIGVDSKVLLFTAAATILTGIVFGLLPALQSTRRDYEQVLRASGRESSGSLRRTLRAGLATAEIGVAVVVLISAGLLVRSFTRLLAVDPGFRPDHLLTFRVVLPASQYAAYPRVQSFYTILLGNLRATRGVTGAELTNTLPLTTESIRTRFAIEGTALPQPGHYPVAQFRNTTPGFLHTMGIALRRGRTFTDAEMDPNAPPVCIINETMARRYFNGQDPIGRRVILGVVDPNQTGVPVVGVAADTRESGLDTEAEPQLYFPGLGNGSVVVRTSGDPQSVYSAVRTALQKADASLPLPRMRTMEEIVAASVARRRFLVVLLTIFAGLAVALAGIGLFGVISWSVARRTRELGLRKALGATTGDLIRMVLKEGLTLGATGVLCGTLASIAATRVLGGVLFHVSAIDPATYLISGVTLVAIAAAACIVPGWRAASIEATTALRDE